MKHRAVPLFMASFFAMAPAEGWTQCAMCVTALQNSAEGKIIAQSFGYGILFLLAVPYVVLGAFAFTVFRAYRRKSQQSTKGVL